VVEFLDSAGRRCRQLLSSVAAAPFEVTAPVRAFPVFRGHRPHHRREREHIDGTFADLASHLPVSRKGEAASATRPL